MVNVLILAEERMYSPEQLKLKLRRQIHYKKLSYR